MFLSQLVSAVLLVGHLLFASFKHDGAQSHLIRVEFHDFSYEKLLSLVYELYCLAVVLCFQGHTELELFVIDKSETGRPYLRLGYCIIRYLPSYMNRVPTSILWNRILS